MRAISDLINLDIDIMNRSTNSIEYMIYNDPEFTFQNQGYDPYKLTLIGYVYCWYSDLETHINDMWFLINPKLDDTIKKDKILVFLMDLLYISIDQRLSKHY